jgi:ubiquinone/menaquinone biosynthesis C-methylase UbiE
MLGPEIERHYAAGSERGRLAGPNLERLRTEELLQRFLPPPPADVLDVGGGPGFYAAWLARRGYGVHLVDAVPLHVEQARAAAAAQPGHAFTAELGDARALGAADESFDAVLLLGPLYHLTERDERVAALAEGRRVVRRGGPVLAAAISRFASLLDGFRHGFILDPAFGRIVDRDLRDGQHRNPDDREEWFTTAYFHLPEELASEVEAAGLAVEVLLGIEGPGWLFASGGDDPAWLEAAMRAARAVEAEPALRAVSAHLLAVGTPIR